MTERIPAENIKIVSWGPNTSHVMEYIFKDTIPAAMRELDARCFGTEMAYEVEYLRQKAMANHGNLWTALNLHPKTGTPFDVGNMLGYILSSRGHKNGSFVVPNNAGYIDALAVAPEAEGQGIGRRLRENVFEHWLDFYKLEAVHTLARPDNGPMTKLNREMGLVAVKTYEPGLYSDGQPRVEYKLTPEAWEAYKDAHPETSWELAHDSRDRKYPLDFKAIRRTFEP